MPQNLGKVTAIAIGNSTSPCCLALREDGTVAAWGGNTYGQCDVSAGLNNVVAIAAGNKHCLALKADGTVVAWGDNTYGQCDVPASLNNVARIYTRYNCDFSLALKNDGTVVAWGSNQESGKKYYCGQCDVPEGLSGVVDIVINGQTCIALKSNGTVVVWGNNYCGQRNVPPGLHDVAAISSANGVAAIKTDGTVVNWGYGIGGSLDNSRDRLVGLNKVLTISNWTAIFRDGALKYVNPYGNNSSVADTVNAALEGLNVLSGHYFNINKAELLNPAGQSISSVAAQGGYRIEAQVANNYASPTSGLTIIQVRGDNGATNTGGGKVLGCVGLSGDIPVTGSTVSSDFTMPAGISGKAYVDVFVWDGWDTMVPRAKAKQDLSFSVTE